MPVDLPLAVQARRRILHGAALFAAAAALPALRAASAAEGVPYSSGSEAPRMALPSGAVDCHMHIYDSRFPVAPNATLRPPDAGIDDFRRLQARLGTARTVVVQPSTYGTDNRCTLDALARLGATARAVAVVDTTVADSELDRMALLGVRGIRFNLVQAGATSIDMLEPLARRMADRGWHVQIHMKADQIAQAEALLMRLPCPVVFDHLARVPPQAGLSHPGFASVRKLLDGGRAWVKLSGAYHDSVVGEPTYADMAPVARAYVAAAPERVVWGSDWPHPTTNRKPDDAHLLDLLLDWAPEASLRKRILVDNPQRLYGFEPVA